MDECPARDALRANRAAALASRLHRLARLAFAFHCKVNLQSSGFISVAARQVNDIINNIDAGRADGQRPRQREGRHAKRLLAECICVVYNIRVWRNIGNSLSGGLRPGSFCEDERAA